MTSYQFMLQMDRGKISDLDDDCQYPRYTIFADRMESLSGRERPVIKEGPVSAVGMSEYPGCLGRR
eukprot:3021599-Amphidinium_carterae.1